MEYRKLGNTELEVSAIAFGAWAAGGWMWGGTDRNEAIRAIREAYDLGVTSIDTAPVYGQGASEELVAEAIRDLPRDRVQLLTKFGMRWDMQRGDFASRSMSNEGKVVEVYKYAGKESIMKEVEDSLRRLRTDYIDLYQLHWPDSTTPIPETFEAVSRLLEQGKIRYAGVCNYNVSQMAEAEKSVSLASNQVPYSMVNRGIEEQVVPYCMEQGKAILAYSPLERGLLTGKINAGHKFSEGDHRAQHPSFSAESIARTNAFLERIRPLADTKCVTLAQLVLRWTLDRPGITVVLAGARNARQSVENAGAIAIRLTGEENEFINRELEAIS